MTGTRGDLKREDDRRGPSRTELAMIGISVLATLTLFVYVLVQAVQAPPGPQLTAEVERVEQDEKGLLVHVLLRNEGGVGVRSATVEVPCEDPAPSITFQNIPAQGLRRGAVVCPPGSGNLTASLTGWVET